MSEQHHNTTNDQEPQMNREILRTHARSPAPDNDDPPVHEHPASSTANNNSSKRPKRPFLQFSGARRTRVGDDYQVSLVPPCAAVHHHHPDPHPAVAEIPVESAPPQPPSPPGGLQNTANPNDANDNTTLSTTDKDVHV